MAYFASTGNSVSKPKQCLHTSNFRHQEPEGIHSCARAAYDFD